MSYCLINRCMYCTAWQEVASCPAFLAGGCGQLMQLPKDRFREMVATCRHHHRHALMIVIIIITIVCHGISVPLQASLTPPLIAVLSTLLLAVDAVSAPVVGWLRFRIHLSALSPPLSSFCLSHRGFCLLRLATHSRSRPSLSSSPRLAGSCPLPQATTWRGEPLHKKRAHVKKPFPWRGVGYLRWESTNAIRAQDRHVQPRFVA